MPLVVSPRVELAVRRTAELEFVVDAFSASLRPAGSSLVSEQVGKASDVLRADELLLLVVGPPKPGQLDDPNWAECRRAIVGHVRASKHLATTASTVGRLATDAADPEVSHQDWSAYSLHEKLGLARWLHKEARTYLDALAENADDFSLGDGDTRLPASVINDAIAKSKQPHHHHAAVVSAAVVSDSGASGATRV